MKSRCVLLSGDGGLVHKEPDREPTAASLAGRDGPEAGAFCSKPSLATVYHPHFCSGCSSRLECSPLTLRCFEATPLLFWGPLLAPHLLHQDSVPHCPYLSPLAHPETGACVRTHMSRRAATLPHLQELTGAGTLGVFSAPSTG